MNGEFEKEYPINYEKKRNDFSNRVNSKGTPSLK